MIKYRKILIFTLITILISKFSWCAKNTKKNKKQIIKPLYYKLYKNLNVKINKKYDLQNKKFHKNSIENDSFLLETPELLINNSNKIKSLVLNDKIGIISWKDKTNEFEYYIEKVFEILNVEEKEYNNLFLIKDKFLLLEQNLPIEGNFYLSLIKKNDKIQSLIIKINSIILNHRIIKSSKIKEKCLILIMNKIYIELYKLINKKF